MDNQNVANKMHLYLKNCDQQKWLIIQLTDGYVPTVAGISNYDTHTLSENLEPAIWFKVMVFESVSVDCVARMVTWTNGQKNEDGTPVTYSMFGGDSTCYDFDDDIDVLFDLAATLIKVNPLAEPNEANRKKRVEEFEQNLFRMIHCYILTGIVLQPRDLEFVRSALIAQNRAISRLEDVTLMHSRLAEHYQSQMRSFRDTEIAPVMSCLSEDTELGKDFYEILLYDLRKTEPLLRREIDDSQRRVDALKALWIPTSTNATIKERLAEARIHRDVAHEKLAAFLVMKETAIGGVWRDVSTDFGALNDICRHYVNMHQRVQEEKLLAKKTVDKKLLAVSVRECIQSVLEDLVKGQESTGEEITIDGKRATDVMDGRDTNPEWQTLSQRLTQIVHDKDHPIGCMFHRFFQRLELNYRQILRSVEHFAFASTRFLASYDDFYVITEKDLGFNKLYLEDQKNVIFGHLYQMTEILSEHFNERDTMLVRKIRLCYEKSFFNKVGRDLLLLYRVVHGQAMQTLEKRVRALKEVQIDQLGLQMRDEWWLILFEENDSSDVALLDSTDCTSSVNDFSDYDDDEYCSDGDGDVPYLASIQDLKVKLIRSKRVVLSRSLSSDCLVESHDNMLEMSSRLMKNQIMESVQKHLPKFDKELLRKYLQDEQECVGGVLMGTRRCLSSMSLHDTVDQVARDANNSVDNFDTHFGKAVACMKNVFVNCSPLKKMQCLTSSLQLIVSKVEELRMRGKSEGSVDRSKIVVTAEDLLPLLVLVLLKMAPHDISKLYVELLFIADLMADFLSSGCHSYALCEFQIAFRVLDQTCEELNL